MHSIEIKKVSWKNFFRYGNNLNYVEFNKGLTVVRGKNGLGKTTIENVISYCFFGKINRGDVKLAQLINKTNKKNLFTEVYFNRIDGDTVTEYVITRMMKPNKIIISKNSVELTEIPADVNVFIARDILGFNIDMFKNIFSVSPLEVDSFLKMEAKDKRKLIETVFNLSKIEIYLKNSKIKFNEYDLKRSLLEANISSLNSKLTSYEDLLKVSKKNDNENIEMLLNRISSIQEEILFATDNKNNNIALRDIVLGEINSLNIVISNLKQKLIELNSVNTIKEVNLLKARKEHHKTLFLRKKQELDGIADNYTCTTCGTVIDTAEKAKVHRDNVTQELASIKKEASDIVLSLKEYDDKLAKISEVEQEIQGYSDSISGLKLDLAKYVAIINSRDSIIESKNREIMFIQTQIDKINSTDDSNNINEINTNITKTRDEIAAKMIELTNCREQLEACQYLIKLFSDEGIKKFLLKKFIPIFNKLINHYLMTFKLNTKLVFDEYFDYTLESSEDVGDTYGSLSGGQRNRINISILFALNDLISIIGNFKCNSLIIDEFIDSGVDLEGLLDSINILKELCTRYNKSIFIVSHKAGKKVLELMDYCYKVLDDNGFSIINKIPVAEEINHVLDTST